MRPTWQATITRTLLIVFLALSASGCGLQFGESGSAGDLEATETPGGETPRGVLLDEPVPAPDFELIAHEGESFRLSEHRDGVTAIFFGYTGCPDVCPLTLSFMSYAAEELGDQAEDVTFLFVTVDPERDDVDRLAKYIERIDTPLIALTGDRSDLEAVWKDYDISVERHERDDGRYLIDHSAQIWLVDANGDLTMYLPMGPNGEDLANDLRWLLDGKS